MTINWEIRGGVCFTKHQATGALPNGTRIEKTNSEPGDGHQDGATGTVIGSLAAPKDFPLPDRFAYFVAWDEDPGAGLPVGIREGRIKELNHG
jgi:hypothetical protein